MVRFYLTIPSRSAFTAACVRSDTCIFAMMFCTCFFAVSSVMYSTDPISLLVMPSTTRRRTSVSRD